MSRSQGQHRTTSGHALRARWKRMQAKVFNAAMPEVLHKLIKKHAMDAANEAGGQPNMNKVIVEALFKQFGEVMTEDERAEVEAFVSVL